MVPLTAQVHYDGEIKVSRSGSNWSHGVPGAQKEKECVPATTQPHSVVHHPGSPVREWPGSQLRSATVIKITLHSLLRLDSQANPSKDNPSQVCPEDASPIGCVCVCTCACICACTCGGWGRLHLLMSILFSFLKFKPF